MTNRLDGKKIAFLATDGFEQSEFTRPWEAVKEAGGEPMLVSLERGTIQGYEHLEAADTFEVDLTVAEADEADFEGLVLPGGLANPDTLRMNDGAVDFVRSFFRAHKPVSAICHAPWLLVEAGVVEGRTLTSWPSLETDIRNAGGHWVDEEVHVDEGLVTSRRPEDLDAFCAKAVEELCEGRHAGQVA